MDNEENEVIDLTEILSAVRQHLLELIFVTLAAALVGFTASKFLMTPKYDSSALMIVNTRQDVTSMLPVTRSILQPSWFLLTALLSRVIRFCSGLLITWA